MSYSFSARAATKAEVMSKVDAELTRVVVAEPDHAADQKQAKAATEAFLAILPNEPGDGKDFYISVSGSLSWASSEKGHPYTGASISVSASVRTKE